MSREAAWEEGRLDVVELAGVVTPVRSLGSGGVPLVLLHGILSEGESWAPVAGPLARGRRVVVPDLPLHGATRTPEDFRPNADGLVAWLEALLDALGVARADLCGLSLGGAVASHFASARPGRVRRLVLVDAANVAPLDEAYRQFIDDMRERLGAALEAGMEGSSTCWTGDQGLEDAKAAAADLCADPIVMSVLFYLEARGIPFPQVAHGLELLRPLTREQLGRITAPTMAIWGADDPFFEAGEAERALREGLPGCRVEVLEATGHNPVEERSQRFLQLVEDFLG